MSGSTAEEALRKELQRTAKTALYFQPVLPHESTSKPTSYYGGRPLLPEGVAWPRCEVTDPWDERTDSQSKRTRVPAGTEVRSTFLGQINLRDLPPADATKLVPGEGTLYFFANFAPLNHDLSDDAPLGSVIYSSDDCTDLPEREEPEDIGPCHGGSADLHFEWLKNCRSDDYDYPPRFSKWALRAIPVPIPDPTTVELNGFASDDPADSLFEDKRQGIEAIAFEIQWETLNTYFPAKTNYHVAGYSSDRGWRGGAGFPYTWYCVEFFFGLLLNEVDKVLRSRSELNEAVSQFYRACRAKIVVRSLMERMAYPTNLKRSSGEVLRETALHFWNLRKRSKSHNDLNLLRAQAHLWIERARQQGRHNRLDDAERDEFLEFYNAIVDSCGPIEGDPRYWTRMMRILEETYRVGPRLSLGDPQAPGDVIPKLWIEDQQWQFVSLGDVMLSPLPPRGTSCPGREYLLLMQVGGLECSENRSAPTYLQFWILPEDLANLRFDRVIAEFSGG